MTIDAGELMNIINELSCNKSLGLDGLSAEHIKFADSQLMILLSILLSQKRKIKLMQLKEENTKLQIIKLQRDLQLQ